MKMLLRRSVLIPFVVALILVGTGPPTYAQSSSKQSYPSDASSSADQPPELMEVLRQHEQYSILAKVLKGTGIDQGLQLSPSFTLLAPTDSAFAALAVPLSEMKRYEVAEVLRNHIIQKALSIRQLRTYSTVENTRGLLLEVGAGVTIEGATLTDRDIAVKNGVVHGIDTVFTMKTKADRGVFSGP